MSNQLQQDHYKLTPKEHETSKASPEGEGVKARNIYMDEEHRSI